VSEPETPLPFATRLWFAWVCFFHVLFDGAYAARARAAELAPAALPPKPAEPERRAAIEKKAEAEPRAVEKAKPDGAAALQLLALFQREGRLVDFLQQDIAAFPDAEVGAAARVVHEGCKKALDAHAKLAPVRPEEEGAKVTLAAGFSPAEVKLSGDVKGSAPYEGVLRHRGWRAKEIVLPTPVKGHDLSVIAPAEVEL
jgi:hypothetical protein